MIEIDLKYEKSLYFRFILNVLHLQSSHITELKKSLSLDISQTRSRSYQTFFSRFFSSSLKLSHFSINNFFLYVIKTQAYQQKTEKFFVSEEKKFGRINSRR